MSSGVSIESWKILPLTSVPALNCSYNVNFLNLVFIMICSSAILEKDDSRIHALKKVFFELLCDVSIYSDSENEIISTRIQKLKDDLEGDYTELRKSFAEFKHLIESVEATSPEMLRILSAYESLLSISLNASSSYDSDDIVHLSHCNLLIDFAKFCVKNASYEWLLYHLNHRECVSQKAAPEARSTVRESGGPGF